MLQEFTNYALLAFAVAGLLSPFIIALLYKFNLVISHKLMKDNSNEEFIRIHGHKTGTPRSGGLIISIPVLILGLIFIPQSAVRDIWAIGWTALALYGLADDLVVSFRKLNDKFRQFQESVLWRLGKLAVLYLILTGLLTLLYTHAGWTHITIFSWTSIEILPWMLPVIGLGLVLALYGVEITDGADALVTSQFLTNYVFILVLISLVGSTSLEPFIGLILGASLIYLYFNINPARVFMGGSGTLPIAFTLAMIAILTDTVPYLVLAGAVYWLELASSFIQIFSIKFLKRKFFRIAPLHHHFEAKGWSETKVVQRFWLASMVAAIFALWVFSLVYGV